jgi:hypothetical protein
MEFVRSTVVQYTASLAESLACRIGRRCIGLWRGFALRSLTRIPEVGDIGGDLRYFSLPSPPRYITRLAAARRSTPLRVGTPAVPVEKNPKLD